MAITKEDISAIIVSYESAHIIGRCLELLEAAKIKSIVVDNASQDDTARIAVGHGAQLIANDKNQGFGRANNIGAAAVQTDWILFVNPDLEIDEKAIDALLHAANNYENIGILGPKIIENDGRLFLQPRSLLSPHHLNQAREISPIGDCCIPFLSGACMMMRRELFFEIGGFDSDIFLFYEDDDLCAKVSKIGLSLIYVDQAVVKHGRGKSSKAKHGHIFRVRYHLAWSKIHISRKYGLKQNPWLDIAKNGIKYFFAIISLSTKRQERYGGSFKGALDAVFNKSAIAKENLE